MEKVLDRKINILVLFNVRIKQKMNTEFFQNMNAIFDS
jgi:hypothetical protein